MIKILTVASTLLCGLLFAQKKDQKTVAEKFQAQQPQDFSVPPPPVIAFPAQFSGGNKLFLKQIKTKLAVDNSNFQGKKSKLILKIAADGMVLNISAYGNDEHLNMKLKQAAREVISDQKWVPGKNARGENVIDVVTLPFVIAKK